MTPAVSIHTVSSPLLAGLPGVGHAFATRAGGVSRGLYASLNCGLGSRDVRDDVLENRNRVREHLAAAALISPYQVHGTRAVEVTAPWEGTPPEADALVTQTPGLAIGILTADCGPLLFADGDAGVVACAHAGWKGARGNIMAATLAEMERLGARRERIRVALGPMISAQAYEVGPEFADHFADDPQALTPSARAGYFHLDLSGYLERMLRREGVKHSDSLNLCTCTDAARFFSYRRATHLGEADYGRQISAIVLR